MVKRRDAWATVLLVDPVASPLVRRVVPFGFVTPNRITYASNALRAGAIAAVIDQARPLALALWIVAFYLDCMDGKLARARGTFSRFGALVDQWSDIVGTLAYYGAIAAIEIQHGRIISAVLIACWLLVWIGSWLGQKSEDYLSRREWLQSADSTRLHERWDVWTARHRLRFLPVSDIETLYIVMPIAYAVGEVTIGALVVASYSLIILAAQRLATWRARAVAPVGETPGVVGGD